MLDWEYLNVAQRDKLKGKLDWKIAVPDGAIVGAYYIQAISKDAPHPAAARLWEEFLYSDEGQNIWLQGFARPVRLDAMVKADTSNPPGNEARVAALGAKRLETAGIPSIVTEFDSTTVILDGYVAEIDRSFNLLIQRSA